MREEELDEKTEVYNCRGRDAVQERSRGSIVRTDVPDLLSGVLGVWKVEFA